MDRNEKAKGVIISLFVIAIVVCVVWFVWSTVWSWLTSLSLEGGGPRRLDVITAPPDSLIALDDEGQKIPPGDTLYVSGQDTIKIPSCGERVEVWPEKKKPERIEMEEEFAFSDRGGLVYVSAEREEKGLWIVHDQLESYRCQESKKKEKIKKEAMMHLTKPQGYGQIGRTFLLNSGWLDTGLTLREAVRDMDWLIYSCEGVFARIGQKGTPAAAVPAGTIEGVAYTSFKPRDVTEERKKLHIYLRSDNGPKEVMFIRKI